MLAKITPIGTSKGIRIPKHMLESCNIHDQVNIDIQDSKIIITPINKPIRKDWNKLFTSSEPSLSSEDTEWLNGNLIGQDE